MAQIDEIVAELDQYTNYCRLVDYNATKAEEYVLKAAAQLLTSAGLLTAVFPIVGSQIVAAKAALAQGILAVAEPIEGVAAGVAGASKLAELEPPEEGCD
jgi:hypothetical protein